MWLIEATRYQVLPLDDRSVERFLAAMAGRPELITGTSQILFGGMRRLSEGSVISVKKSFTFGDRRSRAWQCISRRSHGRAGGAFGGWSLYAIDGHPRYCHNLAGLHWFIVEGTRPIPPGVHQVRMEFTADGQAPGVGGTATLYIDGQQTGSGHIDATVPMIFSGDETLEVGSDAGTPVSRDYPAQGNEFTGKVRWVQIDVDEQTADHLVHPEDRLRVIMGRQVSTKSPALSGQRLQPASTAAKYSNTATLRRCSASSLSGSSAS